MSIELNGNSISFILENMAKTTNPMGNSADDTRIEGEFNDIAGEDGEISKGEFTDHSMEAGDLSEDEAKEVTEEIFGDNESMDYDLYREKNELIGRVISE